MTEDSKRRTEDDRNERLKRALRANLKRRKAQDRARKSPPKSRDGDER